MGICNKRIRKKIYRFVIVIPCLTAIASCSNEIWVNDTVFFGRFLKWEDDEKRIIFKSQRSQGYVGKAEIMINGVYYDADMDFCSYWGFPSPVYVTITDEDFALDYPNQIGTIQFSKNRVKKPGGGFYDDRIDIRSETNFTEIPEWDDATLTMFSSPIDEADLDAREFRHIGFFSEKLNTLIEPNNHHLDRELSWIYSNNQESFLLSFGDERTFSFSGERNSYGTYIPTREDITFHFEQDEIFDLEGSDLTFAYDFY
ncbi:MAG: hypothetical protein IJ247_06535 [Bacilli bacterium]|nr:hypothetical protein [Bacilli bacterium]